MTVILPSSGLNSSHNPSPNEKLKITGLSNSYVPSVTPLTNTIELVYPESSVTKENVATISGVTVVSYHNQRTDGFVTVRDATETESDDRPDLPKLKPPL